VASLDATFAETPTEACDAGTAANGNSGVVGTSAAIVATTTVRPALEIILCASPSQAPLIVCEPTEGWPTRIDRGQFILFLRKSFRFGCGAPFDPYQATPQLGRLKMRSKDEFARRTFFWATRQASRSNATLSDRKEMTWQS
jgi:hypothetical protein